MQKSTVLTLATGLLASAFLVGCGSASKTQTAAAVPGMQKGKVVSVEPVSTAMSATAPAGSTGSMSTSGMSSTGTGAAGTPSAIITVQNADGTQSRYSVTQNRTTFKVGDTVSMVPDGSGTGSSVIMKP